jgi:hypothetical protein
MEFHIDGAGNLVITTALQEGHESKSGKTWVLATTGGMVNIPIEGTDMQANINITRRKRE